jgi:hypothetical protein
MWPLWQSGQRIATETPLIGRVLRSRTAGRRERLAGKNNRSDDESRAVSWRGMPRQKAGYSRVRAIFPRTGYIRASAAATPKTRPRTFPQRSAFGFLPAIPWSRAAHRKPAIESTVSKPADIVRASAHIRHKTGFQLQAFRSFSFPLHYGSYQPPSGETQHQNCKKIVYYILLILVALVVFGIPRQSDSGFLRPRQAVHETSELTIAATAILPRRAIGH